MFKNQLLTLCDDNYKGFSSKLIPSVNPDVILGVRMPLLRALAKKVEPCQRKLFMCQLPHKYHEENLLHAIFICQNTDVDLALEQMETFLPYVDNWAVCDALTPKVLSKNLEKTYKKVQKWLKSGQEYAIRLGFVTLMRNFLKENFDAKILQMAVDVDDKRYYVKMGQAWFFAESLAKRFEETLPYFAKQSLNDWTHNKSIQKACESYQLTTQQKQYLKQLKV